MQQLLARPWLTFTLAAVGIALAYTAFITRTGSLQAANGGYCPAKQVCADGACDKANCANGDCKGSCAHCNKNV